MKNRKRAFRPLVALLIWAFAIECLAESAVWPSASGKNTLKSGALEVDCGNASDGYIMVRGGASSRKLKIRISRGESMFTFDLNTDDQFEVFPLQLGSGSYVCELFENAKGSKFSQAGIVTFDAALKDDLAPYLCPNQYVSYGSDAPAVAKAAEICAGLQTPGEKFNAIREYVKRDYTYDFVTAVSVKPGRMPDISLCFGKGKGICQDLSAMAVCMLRSQGVPAQLMIGYAENRFHAWVTVFVDGAEVMYDPSAEVGLGAQKEYSVERYY